MKVYLLFISMYSLTVFGQQKAVEIKSSPNSNVLIGNGNTVNNFIVMTPLAISSNNSVVQIKENDDYTFKVQVLGGVKPYSYKWFINDEIVAKSSADSLRLNHVKIQKHNAKITVNVTDAQRNMVNSEVGIVKVMLPFTISYSKIDPYVNDTTIPKMEHTFQQYLCHDSTVIFKLPREAEDAFFVVCVPSSELLKYGWYNTDVNSGDIPDIVLRRPFTIGKLTYYVTRNEFAFSYRQPVILLNR